MPPAMRTINITRFVKTKLLKNIVHTLWHPSLHVWDQETGGEEFTQGDKKDHECILIKENCDSVHSGHGIAW